MPLNILQDNRFLALEEVVERTVEHNLAGGTLVEGNLEQGTLEEDKHPLMDSLVGEEHQLEAVVDDRNSS